MNVSLVLTIIGADKPALVDAIASVVSSHEGNWLESRLMRLGGQFAGILRIELPSEKEKEFMAAVPSLDKQGLSVSVHRDTEGAQSRTNLKALTLVIVGQDRPGIVRQISRALAENGANVEEFESECISAAMSGETLFQARVLASVTQEQDLTKLQTDLEKIAADLMVEVSFES